MADLQTLLRAIDELKLEELEQIRAYIEQRRRALAQSTQGRRLSARELLKLPREERDKILQKAAAEAEAEYRTNPALTDFEAFGEDDLYDETP